jgi:hypothetical protein
MEIITPPAYLMADNAFTSAQNYGEPSFRSEATKQSSGRRTQQVDCFAALAMMV